ncbi:MAG: DUF362 domain-containing protein [Candidatus Latescibacterota bacterium]
MSGELIRALPAQEQTSPRTARRPAPSVFLGRLGEAYLPSLREGLGFVGLGNHLRPGDTVFVKPNLTYPVYRPGVMTSPACIEDLVVALKDYGARVIVGESDGGGYNRFPMHQVFAATGLGAMAARHGIELVNLSQCPSRAIRFDYRGRVFSLPLPVLLLDRVDVFITVPVPKVHANTRLSLSIKNQWGCIQEPALRLRLHPYFAAVIHQVNRALKVRFSVVDGRWGLNRNGPMRGDAVPLGWLLVSDDLTAADVTCARLMGVQPRAVPHLRDPFSQAPLPPPESLRMSQDPGAFAGPRFYLQREFWDLPGLLAFRHPGLAYLAYRSPLARILHRGLYLFREKFYEHD